MPSIPALRTRDDLRLLVVALTILVVLVAAEHASAVDRIQRTGMFNGAVTAISEPDADGTRYLGGSFTRFDAWATGFGASLDPATAAVDPSFPRIAANGSLAQEMVTDVVPDGNGGLFVAGGFDEVDGQTRYGLARINADGSLNTAWTSGLSASTNNRIFDIERAGDVLYVVGNFQEVQVGITVSPRRSAAAFDVATGALLPWSPKIESGAIVNAIAVDVAGSVAYIGGSFDCVNAPSGLCTVTFDAVRALAKVDLVNGVADAGFDAQLATGDFVDAVALPSGGSWLYFGGRFASVRSTARANAAVIRTDGSNTLGTWAPNPSGTQARVYTLVIDGSTVYLGGTFETVASGGSPVNRRNLAAVSLDPTAAAAPTALSAAIDLDRDGSLSAVRAVMVDGSDVYVGGTFASVGGVERLQIAKLASDGSLQAWNPGLGRGPSEGVHVIERFGAKFLVGGDFSQVGGTVRTYAAAVDADGYLTDWSAEFDGVVNAVAVADGKVFLGGRFTQANGATRNRAAAFDADGTLDANWDPNLGDTVNAMTVVGSTIYLGGRFTTASGMTRYRAAAFSTAGGLDAWDPNLNSEVLAMTSIGSVVYLGGGFSTVGGGATTRNSAAALDTSGALVSAWNPDLDDSVYAMTALGSTIYLGGEFTTVLDSSASVARNGLAAFTDAGSLVAAWDPSPDYSGVYALAAGGSTIYVGGDFAQVGVAPRQNAAAVGVDGTVQAWAPNATREVSALAVSAASGVTYLGGSFTALDGGASTRSYSAAVASNGTILDPWPRTRPAGAFALTVTKTGAGGTVASNRPGISCGATCMHVYLNGSVVTLTATPDASSTFAGWGGACSGTATTCTVVVDQARAVTAEFASSSSPSGPSVPSGPSGSSASPTTPGTSLRVVAVRGQGQEVVVSLRTSGPGRISAVGTVAGAQARASRAVVCTAAKQVRTAGVARLICRLNATGRALLTRQALSVRVTITYRPASGTTRRAARTVRLAQLAPSPTPVTG